MGAAYYDQYDDDVFRSGDSGTLLSPIRSLCHSGSYPSLSHFVSSLSPSPQLLGSNANVSQNPSLFKTVSMSALDKAQSELRFPQTCQASSGSPTDLVPKRWASPPNASSFSPAVSATVSAASKIRLDSSTPSSTVAVGRHQVLFEVQHDHRSRPILVESYTTLDTSEYSPSPCSITDLNLDLEQNPFSLHNPAPKLANNRRRWVHLFPKQEEPLTQLNLKSLCTPAILPLTTDYFPNLDQLQKEFRNTVQTLSLVPNDRRYHDQAEHLVTELITQRLTNDFQLMVVTTRDPGPGGVSQHPILYQLSLGSDHHQVILDRSTDNIQVHRYFRHSNVAHDSPWATGNQPAFPYRYFLWSDACATLLPIDALIRASTNVPFNWNYADQLVAGHVDALSGPNLNYRRIRFALSSASSLAEGRVQDVERLTIFLETLFGRDVTDLNLRWVSQIPEPLGAGTLDAFVNVDLGFVDDTDRYQSFSVCYDSIVDESACFHIEVRWMMATGASIRRWIENVLRPTAKDAQITLLQLPACHYQPRNLDTFLSSSTSPFQAVIPISLPSQSLISVVRSFFLPKFEYVLDTTLTLPIQYIHSSGMSMIRIDRCGLQWIPHPKSSCSMSKQQFDKIHELCMSLTMCRDTILSITNDIVDNLDDIQISIHS